MPEGATSIQQIQRISFRR